jgi:hypothetical protein
MEFVAAIIVHSASVMGIPVSLGEGEFTAKCAKNAKTLLLYLCVLCGIILLK